MDDSHFLRAIAAAPDDRSLRLVYADWLEDHGDARAELIRIEEEMRELPIFGDRFWELKKRRNALRASTLKEWLESMGYGIDVAPVFKHGWPDDCLSRWRIIRELYERWYELPLPDVGGQSDHVEEAESRIGVLPLALREWIALAHDIMQRWTHGNTVLINEFDILAPRGQDFITFLGDRDGAFFWAVQRPDLSITDPPVQFYERHLETRGYSFYRAENPYGGESASLTAFILKYAIYLMGWDGYSLRDNLNVTTGRDFLHSVLPIHCVCENMEIFEADDMLVRFMPVRRKLAASSGRSVARDKMNKLLSEHFANDESPYN